MGKIKAREELPDEKTRSKKGRTLPGSEEAGWPGKKTIHEGS